MSKLLEKWRINLLRDLRQLESGWASIPSYLFFLETTPKLERLIRTGEPGFKMLLGMDADQVLNALSKDRPATNFNSNNRLGKPRPRWSREQVNRLRRVQGL